jgi:hypothetical protein
VRSHLVPVADVLVSGGTGVLLALIAIDARSSPGWVSLGVALAVIQGAALHWRRRRPELVMLVTLVAAAAFFALAPDSVIPFAPLFAVHSRAATRPPPRVASRAGRPRGPVRAELPHHVGRRHDVHDGAGGRLVGARRGGA